MGDSFLTVKNDGNALIEVKKSKFIAAVHPVLNEQDALLFLNAEIKKYYDAKHHCSAEVIRPGSGAADFCHSSDDGEPSGTAGKPMLEVLNGAGLKNVICVVTRYFGGTLLGTGGLVRAYTDAASAAVKDAEVVEMCLMANIRICFEYSLLGKIQYILGKRQINIIESNYDEKVTIHLRIVENDVDITLHELTEAAAGRLEFEQGISDFYPVERKSDSTAK